MAAVKRRTVLIVGLSAVLLIGAVVLYALASQPGSALKLVSTRPAPPAVGLPAANFRLAGIDGNEVELADFVGKQPVIVNFWATWCPPCKAEMPLLDRAARKYDGQVVVLGVNSNEDLAAIKKFTVPLGLQFPILMDSNGRVTDDYYVRSFPATFFIDADGVIRAQHLGQLTEENLPAYLETIGVQP